MTATTKDETEKNKALVRGNKAVYGAATLVFLATAAFAGYESSQKFATAEDFANNTAKREIVLKNLTDICRNSMENPADDAGVRECAERNTKEFMDGTSELEAKNGFMLAAAGLATLGIAGFYGRKYRTAANETSLRPEVK